MKQTRLKCVTLFFHPDKVKSRNCSSSSWGLLLAMTAPGRREFTHSLGKSQSKYGPESTSDSAIMKSNWWKMQFLPASLSSVKGLDSGSITELLFILLLPCLVRVYLDREEDTKICWDFFKLLVSWEAHIHHCWKQWIEQVFSRKKYRFDGQMERLRRILCPGRWHPGFRATWNPLIVNHWVYKIFLYLLITLFPKPQTHCLWLFSTIH